MYEALGLNGMHFVNILGENQIIKINNAINYNEFDCLMKDDQGNEINKTVFFKFAPIIDYIKYISGSTPNIDENQAITQSINNSSYIDGLFSFLASNITVKDKSFVHSVEWYATIIGIKKEYIINIADDYSYVKDIPFFNKKKGILFIINNELKPELQLGETIGECTNEDFEELDQFVYENEDYIPNNGLDSVFDSFFENSSNSSCSSRSSITEADYESGTDEDEEEEEEEGTIWSSSSDESEEHIDVTIYNFPVTAIAMEKCQGGTLDTLVYKQKLSCEEWRSALFQITATLLKYNKEYNFIHNDLHSNNVVVCPTSIDYLWYNIDGQMYKVKTFGRIFKIIDFGRSIFELNGVRYISESFSYNGDAFGQYNTEPYFNDSKKRIEPNPSFDLTRLACSLIDCDFPTEVEDIINEWCSDDKGKNVLYKRDGSERYPDFKLYKMISRKCHNNTPSIQIKNKFFNRLKTNKKNKYAMII